MRGHVRRLSPTETRAIGHAERGVHLVDAPVTGSAPRAEDGTLTIMVGGDPAEHPLLEAMGKLVVHVARPQGEMAKLINNAVAAVHGGRRGAAGRRAAWCSTR